MGRVIRVAEDPLASPQDVETVLGRDLAEREAERVPGLLAEASDLVAGYLYPTPVPDPIPTPISRVVASMVAAVLLRPSGLLPDTQSTTADIYGVTFAPGSTSPGPYLTAAQKLRLRPYRRAVNSVPMASERGL
jgi:hypothetical protein